MTLTIPLLFFGAAVFLLGLATVICPGWWREPPRWRGRPVPVSDEQGDLFG